jgi:hypothetical protein
VIPVWVRRLSEVIRPTVTPAARAGNPRVNVDTPHIKTYTQDVA